LLAHNVPNPVRFSTHIRFRAAERGRAKLRIFDVAGRLVRTLVDGEIVPGTYNLLWDRRTDAGAKAGAGVYFYRLEMSGERQTRRMVVVP
jgi:flagellar hook assembly protein FlgD